MTDENEWERQIRGVKAKADGVVFPGDSLVDFYSQARKIRVSYERNKSAYDFRSALYCLYLYLRLALEKGLHKQPAAQRQSAAVADELRSLEKRVHLAKRGLLAQVRGERIRDERAAEAARVAAVARAARAAKPDVSNDERNSAIDALRLSGAPRAEVKFTAAPDPAPPSYAAATMAALAAGDERTPELPRDARVRSIIGDGHCAFRALAQGLADGHLDAAEEARRARLLRDEACRLLEKHRHDQLQDTALTIEEVVLIKDDVASFDEYLRGMRNSDHGGETEFYLLAPTVDATVSIFLQNPSTLGYEKLISYGNGATEVRLLWRRGAMGEGGNHYDVLL